MAKKKRQLLKFREGDCGLKIRKDGQLEVAGVDESRGLVDANGMVNPALLFASAWARRDPKCFQALIDNFKESVKEGYFGPDAKRDYEIADKLKKEKEEEEKKRLFCKEMYLPLSISLNILSFFCLNCFSNSRA